MSSSAPAPGRLSPRAITLATLARQHLLARTEATPAAEIAHLGGMQAQAPLAPYVGLWSRIRSFAPDDLSALYQRRRVVRIALMRSTIHLVTAEDALAWRALVEPYIVRATNGAFARHYQGLDRQALAEAARALLEPDTPRTFAELGALLADRFPGRDPAALAQAARAHLPLVQIPPRGLWPTPAANGASSGNGTSGGGRIAHTTTQAWLGKTPLPADPATLDAMVLRYLAAFGPATVMDAQAWSGLTRLREVFDRLRPALRTFTAEHSGAELFDLPDAPRPDPDTPAPVRFLPEYDNLLFAHADRARVNPHAQRIPLFPGNGAALGYFLLDGVYAGLWRTDRPTASASTVVTTLTIQPFVPPSARSRDALTSEAAALLTLLAPHDPAPDIRFAPPPH